jgi:SAM-dependent methyltransferase
MGSVAEVASSTQPGGVEAVRDSYDRVADKYVAMGIGDLEPQPWLRCALKAFAEEVRELGPVLDVGCGPGRVTAYLAGLSVDVSGVDLSPGMVSHARRLHPELRFAVASATELDLDDASYGGILGWWSLFNLPRDVLPEVLARFARALVPNGRLLIGTHVGSEDLVRTEAYDGVPVQWTTYLWQPDELEELLTAAGLEPVVQLRFPASESMRAQVVLCARRPPAVG